MNYSVIIALYMYPVVQHNRQVAFALVMELQVTIFIITVTLHGCLHGSNSQPLSEGESSISSPRENKQLQPLPLYS